MLIDTHCHLDAREFDDDRREVIARAVEAEVQGVVIPAISRENWQPVMNLAHSWPAGAYALGIHPLCVDRASESDLAALEQMLLLHHHDPRLVAIGEIGLDFYIPASADPEFRARQSYFLEEQLRLARKFELPVLLHVRKAQDQVAAHLRRLPVSGAIAHAFNGSWQQAQVFLDLGCVLGFGGAATYPRALRIRELAAKLPLSSLVLETDAPDIVPIWLKFDDESVINRQPGMRSGRNEPAALSGIAKVIADLRGVGMNELTQATKLNACRVLPRLAHACGLINKT